MTSGPRRGQRCEPACWWRASGGAGWRGGGVERTRARSSGVHVRQHCGCGRGRRGHVHVRACGNARLGAASDVSVSNTCDIGECIFAFVVASDVCARTQGSRGALGCDLLRGAPRKVQIRIQACIGHAGRGSDCPSAAQNITLNPLTVTTQVTYNATGQRITSVVRAHARRMRARRVLKRRVPRSAPQQFRPPTAQGGRRLDSARPRRSRGCGVVCVTPRVCSAGRAIVRATVGERVGLGVSLVSFVCAGGPRRATPCRTPLVVPAVPDPRTLLFLDANGDGFRDLVAVGGSAVALFLHRGARACSRGSSGSGAFEGPILLAASPASVQACVGGGGGALVT